MSWKIKDLIVMATGVVLFVIGVWFGTPSYTRIMGIGLMLVGLATVALGATAGFVDSSPATSMMSKLGMLGYALGTPALIYGVWHFG
ncbi:MAG: hypothetical protein ACJ73D_08645 [Pyrinomonadaceae bacterium]